MLTNLCTKEGRHVLIGHFSAKRGSPFEGDVTVGVFGCGNLIGELSVGEGGSRQQRKWSFTQSSTFLIGFTTLLCRLK